MTTTAERLQGAMTLVLVACALVVTVLLVRRELVSAPAGAPAVEEPVFVPGWRAYAREGNRSGPVTAPVVIIEFADFQCPFCRHLASRLDSLLERNPGDVAVVYRHFPLRIHPHAVEASEASECAAAQGRFEPMHDALYRGQHAIGAREWSEFAREAKVPDLSAFEDCMAGAGAMAAVAKDTLAAKALGLTATPTLLINGLQVEGSMSLGELEQLVRQRLAADEPASGS